MQTKEKEKKYTELVSDSFEKTDESCNYEVSFRRWLVGEIEERRMSVIQAIDWFNLPPIRGHKLIQSWRRRYAPQMVLALPQMTEKEKQEMAAIQKRLQILEKDLDDARMRNIALNMLIDVAEEKLKINIRKKPGAKP